MKIVGKSKLLKRAVCAASAAALAISCGLTAGAAPSVSAVSAILINAKTGTVLYEKNSLEERAIASTTKIMTTLLTLEAGDLDRQFTVDSYAIMVEGTSMGLREGDIVTRRALCYGMMLPSGNDAANAAAVSVSGSTAEFAKLMNKRAREIGMESTSFVNASGLDADGHYSTAYDMALLTMEALKNPLFREICGLSSASLEYGNPPYTRWLNNNNKLLAGYEGCIGVKTGFTDNARRCLVSAAERDGVMLIAITLNAPNDWQDHAGMLDYGFSLVESREVEYDCSGLYVPVAGGVKSRVSVKVEQNAVISLTEEEMKHVVVTPVTANFLYGGFDKGEYAGELIFTYNGEFIGSTRLVTAEACAVESERLGVFAEIVRFISKLF